MRFLIGRVRSGKTALIINEIRQTVEGAGGRVLLLVPEQYSHEAERELCAACGDRFSRFAEVMSFSGLARFSMSLHGGMAKRRMDEAGRLLCMAVALNEIRPLLHLYESAAENIDLQALLLQELDNLNTAAADAVRLRETAPLFDGDLREKLGELALIREAWDAVAARSGASTEDPLQVLARQIRAFGLREFDRVYVDGFIDFTGLEHAVLRAMLEQGTDLTVCLPGTERLHGEEYLLPSHLARERLRADAEERGVPVEVLTVGEKQDGGSLRLFTEHMFDYAADPADGTDGQIRLLRPENPRVECELTAAAILDAVRRDGCRWRDIAVAVRGFEDYRGLLESCFRRYGIPLFLSHRDPVTEKPLPFWIDLLYEVVLGGFDAEDLIAFLRCGLSGLTDESCDALCDYLFKWKPAASAWLKGEAFRRHPDGYGKEWTDEVRERLSLAEAARRKVAGPLLRFRERVKDETATCRQQAEALADYMDECRLQDELKKRVERLGREGKLELRAQYLQLWDICSEAVRQAAEILGDMPMDARAFQKLLRTMFSRYDIGIIPVALDRVSAGDFDRMRRRSIRRLFVLGCTDERLPAAHEPGGLFTEDERSLLSEHDICVGGGESELWREYAMIYHTLSLPSEQLVLSAPLTDLSGSLSQPAVVWEQARRMFSLPDETGSLNLARLHAPQPALSLAARTDLAAAGPEARAAARWFRAQDPGRLEALRDAVSRERGRLSAQSVDALYGHRLYISPSRLERFSDCRFGYFCQFGLKAERYESAGFRPPEIGTFLHAVLEHAAREVADRGGFRAVSDDELEAITQAAVDAYVEEKLGGLEDKSPRFRHLFLRLCGDARRIVLDTAEEMRRSDFVPLSFELDIAKLGLRLGETGDTVTLTGIADRVDGWEQDGRLWLRVADYKTGHKKFSFSDLVYGRNMQMLLYLFALCDRAEALYGRPAEPAGILYVPARDDLLHFDANPETQDAEKERKKGKRRSGIVLYDQAVMQAWEQAAEGESVYRPVKTRTSDPEITAEQFDMLRTYVADRLRAMGDEIRSGAIEACPAWTSETENACARCDYLSVCGFSEGENGDRHFPTPKLDDRDAWDVIAGSGEVAPQEGGLS